MEPIVKFLSGAALLTVVAWIARVGFASFVTARAWDEAFQASALFFFLRFGESRFIAPTEVILGILLGAVVGCLSALLRSWTPTVLMIGAAMILIHHPCPREAGKDAVAKHTAPSLGFWQLLLATFGFVYRSAVGGGLCGCLCAAFTHIVMLASAAELLSVLSAPSGRASGGEAADNEGEPVAPRESLRSVGSLARLPSLPSGAGSPTSWGAGTGPRHGAASPPLGPRWRGSGSQLRSPTRGEPAGPGPRSSRRSSLPPFFEGGEQELARLLLPPTAPRVGAGEGARSGIVTRASCPVVRPGATRAGTLLRSASAAAVNAPAWHSGSVAAGAAASSGAYPSVFAISGSPIRLSAGRSRMPGSGPPVGRGSGAAGGTDSAGVAEEGEDSSLPDGPSPDGQSSQARRPQDRSSNRPEAPWEGSGCAAVDTPTGAAPAEPVSESQGAAAGCDADVRSANGDGNGRHGSGGGATQPCESGEAVAVLADARAGSPLQLWSVSGGDGAIDPRVRGAAVGDAQPRCRYRRETGNSTQEYILLASTTVPGTDCPAAYGSEFNSEDDDEAAVHDEEEEEDDDSEYYQGEEYDMDDMDGGVSDGCFSLVIDTNGTPLGDSMVGINRAWRGAQGPNGPVDVAAAAAAVAAWVDAGATAAEADVLKGYADGEGAPGGDHVVAHAATVADGCWPAADGHNAKAAKPGRAGDGGGRDSAAGTAAATSADAYGAATRGTVPHGPQRRDLYDMAVVRHAVLDRHGCDVADMADFEDEDLMSLQEEAGVTAAVAGATGREQLGPCTLPYGGRGGEDLYSVAAVHGPSSSALTSEARCTAVSPRPQRRLQRPAGLSGLRRSAAVSGVVTARAPASGAGPSGYGGRAVDGVNGGRGAPGRVTGPGVGHKRRQQQQYYQQELEGCGEEEWRVDYVPLQAETLARHTAAINAYEEQRQGDDLVQEQQQQQQSLWQRAEADGPEQDHAGPADGAAGQAARGLSPRAQAAPSLGLLDSFLRDAALLAGAGDDDDSSVGHEGCDMVGLPYDDDAAGDCLDAGAAGEQEWPPLDGRAEAVASAEAVEWEGGLHLHSRRRHGHDRPLHSIERKSRRASRHRDLPGAQQSGDMRRPHRHHNPQQLYPLTHEQRLRPHEAAGSSSRRSGRLAQHQQADRARGRRPHGRKLSAGQLLAREFISRYDQDYGHMYGNVYGTAQPPDLSQRQAYPNNSVPLADGLRQPPHHQQQRGLSPDGAVAAATAAAVCDVSLLAQCPQEWEDELLQTFELSGFDDAHLPLPPQLPPPQHPHQHEHADGAWLPQPGDPTATLADRVWGWLGSPGSPHGASAPQAPAPALGGPCAWGGAAVAATDWYDAISSSGGGWGGGAAALATAASGLLASPQQLRCASAAPTSPGLVNPFASAPVTAASAPSTPPTTVVEPFSAAGQSQAVYRSLSGNRRYEEADKAERRRGISDNYKAALAAAAAAAAAGNRSGPTTPVAASRPPGSPPPPTGPPSKPPDPPLLHSSSMPPPSQAQLSGQEAVGSGASGEARRRPPAVVVGGCASRALFPEEAMPLSADQSVAPRTEEGPAPVAAAAHGVLPHAGEVTVVAAADSVSRQAAVGPVSEAVDCEAIAKKKDEAVAVGEAMAEVQAAPSGSTDVLPRLTIPSEVWTGHCNCTESVVSAAAAPSAPLASDAASPDTRCF